VATEAADATGTATVIAIVGDVIVIATSVKPAEVIAATAVDAIAIETVIADKVARKMPSRRRKTSVVASRSHNVRMTDVATTVADGIARTATRAMRNVPLRLPRRRR
jgi:hypothetical protein